MKLCFDEEMSPERAKVQLREIMVNLVIQTTGLTREEALKRVVASLAKARERATQQSIAENYP
jgi:hypothetical protein